MESVSPSSSEVSRNGSPISRHGTRSLDIPSLVISTEANPEERLAPFRRGSDTTPRRMSTVRRDAEEQLDILINLVLSDDVHGATSTDAREGERGESEGLRNTDGELDLNKIKVFFESRGHPPVGGLPTSSPLDGGSVTQVTVDEVL